MSDFFEIFNPGARHQREQKDLEKVLVVENKKGGNGPRPLDLDSGQVVLKMPGGAAASAAYADPMDTPLVPEPDEKDWTFVLDRPCPECGYVSGEIDHHRLPDLVLAAAAPWAEVLTRREVRVRPAPQVWSPLEYACHVRDVLRVFAGRVELLRTQDGPLFANWDQDEAAITDRYWEQDPATVAAEIGLAASENAEAWASVADSEWQRAGTRSNGSEFTLESLGRYLMHDLRHHLHDVDAA